MPPVSSRTHRKSAPRTISVFSGERPASESNTASGRRLAYSPSDLRIRSSPCSGRTLADGSLSYFGSPIAPNNTASERRQTACVSAGYGSPVASIAQAPTSAFSYLKTCPYFAATRSRTFTASPTISGPIPSPGKSAIFSSIFFLSLALYIPNYPVCRPPLRAPVFPIPAQSVRQNVPATDRSFRFRSIEEDRTSAPPKIPRTENERASASVSDMRHATESSPIVSLRETVRSHIPAKVSDSRDPTTHFRSVVPP